MDGLYWEIAGYRGQEAVGRPEKALTFRLTLDVRVCPADCLDQEIAMKLSPRILVLGFAFLWTVSASATEALTDTTMVLGGPDAWNGCFETPDGQPSWHGWTHADLYEVDHEVHWHVSDHLPLAGQYSFWCGNWFENDCADGYGNNWYDSAVMERAAADPAAATTIRWTSSVQVHSEVGYDYFHVQVMRATGWEDLIDPVDGLHVFDLDVTFTVQPDDYAEGNWIIRFLALSDGAFSDADCFRDTQGLARIDDVSVVVDDVLISSEDFESGISPDWIAMRIPVVGDFASLRRDLDDIDPDPGHQNDSWQVCFVDDGLVVPGTGGTACGEWCYGPDGWVLNYTAGLQGHGVPGSPLWQLNGGVWNGVISPILPWADAADAGELAFDVYAHMLYYDCGMTIYGWGFRATSADDPDQLNSTDWQPTRWSFYNQETMPAGPGYHRIAMRLDGLLPADTRWIQVRLEVHEVGPWCWGEHVWDAPPAPYFDNVAIRAWPLVTDTPPEAPVLALTAAPNPFNPRVELQWSQPTSGSVDLAIYDARGRQVRRLLVEDQQTEIGRVVWDGRDDAGRSVAGGIYLARLRTRDGIERVKLTLVR